MSGIDKDIDQDKKLHKSALIKVMVVGAIVALVAIALYLFAPLLGGNSASVKSANPSSITQTEMQTETLSKEAKSALQQRLNNTKATLLAVDPAKRTWQSETLSHLDSLLQHAYQFYGQSHFTRVEAALDEIDEQLVQFNADYERTYQNALDEARQAYKDARIHDARSAISTALRVKPDDAQAKALYARIDVFEEVQALYEEARVGKIENDLEKQYQALRKIMALDADETQAKHALSQVKRALDNARFSTTLAEAIQAVDAKEYDRANNLLADAASIKPDSAQVATLNARIQHEQHTAGQDSAEAQVKVFAQADEWQTVSMLAEKNLQSYPQSQVLQLAATNAKKLLSAQQTIAQYLAQPKRLSDERIRDNAEQFITQASELSALSPALQKSVTALEAALEQHNAPLPVTIRSDNKTKIKVMGVGIVGKVDEKQISLKPGTYRFEGRREGYRSKIVSVTVSPDSTPISVQLVCDEKL